MDMIIIFFVNTSVCH